MIYNLYSIYDEITQSFSYPFHSINERAAIRSFQHVSMDKNSSIFHSPSDFILYDIGIFDDSTAQFSSHSQPVRVITAQQAINAIKPTE